MTWLAALRDKFYLHLVVPLVPSLPAWFVYGVAMLYADTRSRLERARFQEVVLCLGHVLGPDLDEQERSRIARDYFRNRLCRMVDAQRLAGDGQRLARMVEVHGDQSLREALSQGKGAILCSGHFGSVRACAGLLGVLGFPVTLIANWSFTPEQGQVDSQRKAIIWKPILHHLRRGNLLATDERGTNIAIAMQAAAVLRQNEAIVTNIDTGISQDDTKRAITVDFLGGRTRVLPGPSSLAEFAGASVLTVFLYRREDWRHMVLEIRPVSGRGASAMQECMTRLEAVIRDHPAQWEHWNMRKLVRLNLYPRDSAVNYYMSRYGWWYDWE
jgi:KDO2-lipid IV(A) lauroyltransferase